MSTTSRTKEPRTTPPSSEAGDIAALWARALADRTVLPVVRRETLTWSGGSGDTPLCVALDAENPSDRPSRPVEASLLVAPFGAFLRGARLGSVTIPLLPPGGRAHVEQAFPGAVLPPAPDGLLPLLGNERHFAGNLELWMEGRPHVERHRARLQVLRPGVTSFAYAGVHAAEGESLAFSWTSSGLDWAVELDYAGRRPLVPGDWVPARTGTSTLFVAIRPPLDSDGHGGVSIEVTRRSDGRSVPVEFELEA